MMNDKHRLYVDLLAIVAIAVLLILLVAAIYYNDRILYQCAKQVLPTPTPAWVCMPIEKYLTCFH